MRGGVSGDININLTPLNHGQKRSEVTDMVTICLVSFETLDNFLPEDARAGQGEFIQANVMCFFTPGIVSSILRDSFLSRPQRDLFAALRKPSANPHSRRSH
jgi:hypothetical protein